MTDAPDMRAAAEAALPSGEWMRRRNTLIVGAGDGEVIATTVSPSIRDHIVASQPRAVLALLDAHAAEVTRLRSAIGLLPMSRGELAAENDRLAEQLRMAREALTDAVRSGRLGVVTQGTCLQALAALEPGSEGAKP